MSKKGLTDFSTKMNNGSQPGPSIQKYTWNEITIDPELEAFMPQRPQLEFEAFLEKVKLDGEIKEPVDVWESHGKLILADGHNRYRVAKITGFKLRINPHSWAAKEQVKEWMTSKQNIERRNLTQWQSSYYRGWAYSKNVKSVTDNLPVGKNYPLVERADLQGFKSNIKAGLKNEKGQKGSTESNRTSEVLGRQFGVSDKTIRNDYDFFIGIDRISAINAKLGIQVRDGYEVRLTKQAIIAFGKIERQPTKLHNLDEVKKAISGDPAKVEKRVGTKDVKRLSNVLTKAYRQRSRPSITTAITFLKSQLTSMETMLKELSKK